MRKKKQNEIAYVFDLDNTLIDTQAKVKIWDKEGKVYSEFNSQQYNKFSHDYTVRENCTMDFSEFESFEQLMKEPLLPLFEKLKKIHDQKGEKNIFICTARTKPWMIWNWLTEHGIFIPKQNVLCKFLEEATEDHKARSVRNLSRIFDFITIYEDENQYRFAMEEVLQNTDCEFEIHDPNEYNKSDFTLI